MTKTMVIQHFNLRLTYIFQQEIWMRSKQTPSTSSHSVFGLILVISKLGLILFSISTFQRMNSSAENAKRGLFWQKCTVFGY